MPQLPASNPDTSRTTKAPQRGVLSLVDALGQRLAVASAPLRLAVIAIFALIVLLPGFASLPVTDRDEARFVQASRQMVQSGDPVDIRFQDEPRHKKPVGIYWAQSAAAVVSGQGAEAPLWVWRLPSLIGAVAATVLVAVVAAPLVGPAAATMAALLFAATLILGGEARIAKTDALLLALILGMQAALVRLHVAAAGIAPAVNGRFVVWAFWLCLGASLLVKGPVGPMIVLLTMLAVTLWHRRTAWLRPLVYWPAIAAAGLIVLPWLVAITVVSHGEFWRASVGEDLLAKTALGVEGKGAPPGTYLALMWMTFFPATLTGSH